MLAGCLDVESCCIDGRRGASGPCQRGFYGLGNLVQTNDEDDVFRSPGNGCHAIAVAVDIHDDTILGDSIGTGEIDVSGKGPDVHGLLLFWCRRQVAVNDV